MIHVKQKQMAGSLVRTRHLIGDNSM